MQLHKFRDVFEYARAHSKFYRNLYKEHGILNLKINSWDDVQKVPIINKAMIRNLYAVEEDRQPLTDKLDELRRFADTVIARQ